MPTKMLPITKRVEIIDLLFLRRLDGCLTCVWSRSILDWGLLGAEGCALAATRGALDTSPCTNTVPVKERQLSLRMSSEPVRRRNRDLTSSNTYLETIFHSLLQK
jgi:hypothetical protein